MALYVVATPIGNLNDFSKRGIDTLNNVDYILCEDTRTSSVLLKHFNIIKKTLSYHKFNEKEKSNEIIKDLLKGVDIALISDAGSPCISDPGSILVNMAIKNNIHVFSVPGASAVTSSIMCSGMDSKTFAFYGFLDRESKKMDEELLKIKNDSSKIAIIYESPKRIIKTLNKIKEYFPNSYCMLGNELTKKFEKKYYGKIDEILNILNNSDVSNLGEYVLLIEKEEYQEIREELSLESLIVDQIIKSNCTLKDAVKLVSLKYHYNKNDVYKASLNLKELFK